MTTDEKLDAILAKLANLQSAMESGGLIPATPVHGGPFAGQTPGAPVVYDPATAQPVLDQLNLGSDGPSAYEVARLLAKGFSVTEIIAQAEHLLASTGLPRGEAAYALNVSSHGVGWQTLTNRVEGKPENPIVNPDPASDLLAGISTANGPADMEPYVAEVCARAEQGITWRGTRGREADSLDEAKIKLGTAPLHEWRGWVDERLLRILVLTNVLPLTQNPFMPYPDVTTYAVETVPEWLYGEWVGSR